MLQTTPEQNKLLVKEAFEAVFNNRDISAFEKYWSPDYIQHSAHILPGRNGLRMLVDALPATVKYEAGLMMAEGDFIMAHGRYSGIAGPSWIVVDIIRFENGLFAEHWDIIQDEATRESSKSGMPMFGGLFSAMSL